MKKTFLLFLVFASLCATAQEKNRLLDPAFWKTAPEVPAVQAEILKGSSATAFNNIAMDAVTLAINNGAPNSTIKFLVEQDGNGVHKVTHDGRIYLHWAAYKGNLELVQYLIGKGSDINFEDSHGMTPVSFAAVFGQLNRDMIQVFEKAGLDLQKKYTNGASLLLLAVGNDKDFSATSYLISKGLPLNATDAEGNTAFNYAARSGNIDLLKTLIAKGVRYNDQAVIMAAQGTRRNTNGIAVYRYLVDEMKISHKATGPDGSNVIHLLARKPDQSEIIRYFLSKGLDINQPDKEGNTGFMSIASGNDVELARTVLPQVKDINAVNDKGASALTLAVQSGSAGMVTFLLQQGASAAVTDKRGNNAGYYLVQSYRSQEGRGNSNAAQQDDFGDKLKTLQAAGVDLTAVQGEGNTLYHLALAKNNLDLLKRLEGLRLDINARNAEGLTPLHKAALTAKDDTLLKYLLAAGAQKDLKTDMGETAYDLARDNEYLSRNNISIDFLK